MKRLTILRHGKAAAYAADGGDFDRPLTSRGEADAHRVSMFLRDRLPPPDHVLSSPAIRAAGTARIAATVFGIDEATIVWQSELYLASPADLLAAIRHAPTPADHVLLTGHNPGLEDLIGMLLHEPVDHLPTAGVVSMTLDLPAWSALSAHPALSGDPLIVFPRDLRR